MILHLHLILGPFWFLLVACEEPQSEGLSSTSLLDLSTLVGLSSSPQENPSEAELGNQGDQELDVLQDLLHTAQGSGFSSLETEESSILQSPQYFWDEEGSKGNGSSEVPSLIHTVPRNSDGDTGEDQSKTSSPTTESLETSTTLWYTHSSDETHKHLSTDTLTVNGKVTVEPTTLNNWGAAFQSNKERTVSKTVSAEHTHQTTKLHRKNKKHQVSKNHQITHVPGSVPPPGPPAGSQGIPANKPFEEHIQGEDLDPSTHFHPGILDEEKIGPPKHISVLQGEGHSEAAGPSELPPRSQQVICKDWINLAGKNYVILNMSNDIDCEKFRWEKGHQLFSLLEGALFWKTEVSPRDWVILLSKPNENDNHLLMAITEEHSVVPIKDVFSALGDIKRSLAEIGIEGYSTTVSCQSRPSQPRSDYGKLFIVLVIIGSICVMIIVAGIIYICWQRRLPKLKNMELHFVENGCHDNPTLDVAMDGQSEMQEKKTSLNGGTSHQVDGWETLINKASREEGDPVEEDTHL
ncbi:hypothetical protein XENTR_v10012775 [Xenopus tropicalis]|uniref:Podocalyxin-like 2 n=1 Tax=Xenopus tropicalis TaxID=8364 RepID=A0A6I8QX40_XENTR|nr:podocalyxin-like protein 2 [Xenopus tropicalis]KAE8612241.1 hypothetical protein XENTR_v10012775 [Xenopus tropicalis]|eukprot:XP_002933129.1 PREDICTED: podocalyxin-like protein 2 [Xenopus tropicalis]